MIRSAYLDGLKWDDTRLDSWMTIYLGTKDTELTRAIGWLALVTGVRRVRQRGSRFHEITVPEGLEGTGKSTAIEILAGKETWWPPMTGAAGPSHSSWATTGRSLTTIDHRTAIRHSFVVGYLSAGTYSS